MSIVKPGMFGLVLRKSPVTQTFIEAETSFLKQVHEARPSEDDPRPFTLNEDAHLIGFAVAMNSADLARDIDRLVATGAVEGVDFVATGSNGVLGDPPVWLRVSTGSTGSQVLPYIANS